MNTKYSKRMAIGGIALAGLSLSGCATEKYVDEKVATVQSAHDALRGEVASNTGRITALEGHVGTFDARLDKVEKGKFNYQKVGETALLFDTGQYKLKPEECGEARHGNRRTQGAGPGRLY